MKQAASGTLARSNPNYSGPFLQAILPATGLGGIGPNRELRQGGNHHAHTVVGEMLWKSCGVHFVQPPGSEPRWRQAAPDFSEYIYTSRRTKSYISKLNDGSIMDRH